MSLNRRLKKLLILKLYVSMKKFLTLKPSQTQSQTNVSIKNQDCSKDTANLAAVENMVQRQFHIKPETQVVLKATISDKRRSKNEGKPKCYYFLTRVYSKFY